MNTSDYFLACVPFLPPSTGCLGSTGWGTSTGHCQTLCVTGLNFMSVATALFTGPAVHGRSFFKLRAGRRLIKGLGLPDVYLNMSTTPLLPELSPKPSKEKRG